MRRGQERPLISLETHIHAAFPRQTAKLVARNLDCSPRQARRFVETGIIPAVFRPKIIEVLYRELEKNRKGLEALAEGLRKIAVQEMVDHGAYRGASAMGKDSALAVGSDDRPAKASVT